jgi:hypothetical protein
MFLFEPIAPYLTRLIVVEYIPLTDFHPVG